MMNNNRLLLCKWLERYGHRASNFFRFPDRKFLYVSQDGPHKSIAAAEKEARTDRGDIIVVLTIGAANDKPE
jgi:hypothetical protein